MFAIERQIERKGQVVLSAEQGGMRASTATKDSVRTRGQPPRSFFSTDSIGVEQSWNDDLESLGYVLVYLARGKLPWQGLKAATEGEKDDLVKEKKTKIPVESICEGLPEEFVAYIKYTRSLGFHDKPDYARLRGRFRRLFGSRGFAYDHVYDWTEKRFFEMQNQASNVSEPKEG